MADDPHTSGTDLEADAKALDQLRMDLRKAGPTSGITGPRAAEADALLARVREFYLSIASRQRVRLERRDQGSLL